LASRARQKGLISALAWPIRWLYWQTPLYRLRLHLAWRYLSEAARRPKQGLCYIHQLLQHYTPTGLWQSALYRVVDEALRDSLIFSWVYEPEVCRLLRQYVQPGWVCADVGANIGIIALLMARLAGLHGRVVAFEAFPPNAARLRRNVAIRGLARRIRVENVAIVDGSLESIKLYPGRDHNASEWNVVGNDINGRATTAELEVRATSLDEYFAPGSRLDLVKIDIEGAEALALAGMRRVLRQAQLLLIIEFHNAEGWAGRSVLLEHGYQLFNLQGHALAADHKPVYQVLAMPARLAAAIAHE
jgi:FkbM family methyltransferase